MAVRFNPGIPTIESKPKKTRQGKSVNTILAPTSRNKRKKKTRHNNIISIICAADVHKKPANKGR